jgi:glutamyl-tRNA synthetase
MRPHARRGPDVGGPVGPYIQTERRDLYGKYADLLIAKGGGLPLLLPEGRRRKPPEQEGGDPKARLRPAGICATTRPRSRARAGEPFVIRQKIPREGTTTFRDASFGDITVENDTLDDQVLLKSDGLPTYNFANVVDDHLMGITHVVRGSEYLSSAPEVQPALRVLRLGGPDLRPLRARHARRAAQDVQAPRRPQLRGSDRAGYLTEAVLNYVALLGWSPRAAERRSLR